MPPQLVALTEGPSILLDKPIILIGRHQECDIQIPSRKISRRHCCIAQVNDHLVVRDLCSTNGVRINGQRVQEGQLRSGDEITIGNYRYNVSWSSQPPLSRSSPASAVKTGKDKPPAAPVEEIIPFDSCEEPIPLPESAAPDAKLALAPIMPVNDSVPPTLKKNETPKPPNHPPILPVNDSNISESR